MGEGGKERQNREGTRIASKQGEESWRVGRKKKKAEVEERSEGK